MASKAAWLTAMRIPTDRYLPAYLQVIVTSGDDRRSC
jgi:hypothetical protein